jgi:hypothetical protein
MKKIIVLTFLLASVVPLEAQVNKWVVGVGCFVAGFYLQDAATALKTALQGMSEADQVENADAAVVADGAASEE